MLPRRQVLASLRSAGLLATMVAALVMSLSSAAYADAPPVPNDPLSSLEWQFAGDGPMGIDSAWAQTTGGPVVVAVLDSGIDLGQPDLAGNLWANPNEVGGNGVDDDHDGLVDDVNGWNFVNNNNNVSDNNGHGTHVAGIIGADGNNGVGVTGVDWNAKLMAVKVLDSSASGDDATVAKGLRYAVAHGARIVNMSLASPSPSTQLRSALTYAQNAGVLVVTAAGNFGENLRSDPSYPASYGAPNVIDVAASDQAGALDPTSDFGSTVNIAAPGTDIVSTSMSGGYELRTGTSMASAIVSGVAALVASQHPDWRWPQLRAAIIDSARHTGLPVAGGAAVDAGAAVAWTPPANFNARLTTPVVHATRAKPVHGTKA
jgi:subtilisin family serine protease